MKTLLLVLSIFSLSVLKAEDKKLQELKREFDAAETQTDLNITSSKVSRYLNVKLEKLEKEIKEKLSPKPLNLFIKSSELWRGFRAAKVSFEGSLYEGGSIQPLIHNTTYSSLTEQRIKSLKRTLQDLNK